MTSVPFKRDPNFGRDPWIGPRPKEEVQHEQLFSTVRLFTGADALTGDIRLLPPNLDVYMSYVDNYKGWNELVARFNNTRARLVSITIFGNKAQCADVEPGAMHVTSLPHWLDSVADKSKGLPWVYTSAGNMATVNQYIGNRKVIRWSAHYGHGPHVCGPHTCGYPQADWTQWADTGAHGENLDRSVGLFIPRPQPSDPHGYHRFFNYAFIVGKRHINERDTVVEYDRRRPRPVKNAARLLVLGWHARLLAGRIKGVAKQQGDWNKFDREWRYKQLDARGKGRRVV